MQQADTSQGTSVPVQAATLAEAFQRASAAFADRQALRSVDGSVGLTWAQLGARVRSVATGFDALGVRRGDRVAVLMRNLVENHLADYAVAHLGAIPFGIFNTSSREQIAYQVGHAGARVVITESRFLDRVRGAVDALPGVVEHVVVVDGTPAQLRAGELTLAAVESAPARVGFDFDRTWRAIEPEDVECIIFTSGTTGPPKAAQWSNRMIMSALRSMDRSIPLPRRALLSFLPMAHAGGRNNAHHYALVHGATITACPDFADVPRALVEARPDQFMSSPRMFEKLQVAIESIIERTAEPRRGELRAAVELGLRFAHMEDARSAGSVADLEPLRAERERGLELLRPVLAAIGFDRLEAAIIGGATVAPELVHFFRAVGVPMLEAYGCTEVLLNVFNRVHHFKTGTAGKPLPDVELRLAADGEILCRGPLTMSGYLGDPEKTAEVIDADGWVYTGDIGVLDDDGFLSIVDRKKEIIINSHGKNMSPAVIETAVLEQSSLIAQFVAIGEARRYVTGLVTIDLEAAATLAQSHPELAGLSPEDLVGSAAVHAEVEQAIARGNASLNSNEQVKRFAIVGPAWEVDGDELTPTAKVKRRIVGAKYASDIEGLYAERATAPTPT